VGNIDDRCIVYDELGMATVGLESIKALSNELKVIYRTIESNIYIGNENYAIRGEFKLQPSTTDDPVFLFHFAGKQPCFSRNVVWKKRWFQTLVYPNSQKLVNLIMKIMRGDLSQTSRKKHVELLNHHTY